MGTPVSLVAWFEVVLARRISLDFDVLETGELRKSLLSWWQQRILMGMLQLPPVMGG